jgi:hypothetical protein
MAHTQTLHPMGASERPHWRRSRRRRWSRPDNAASSLALFAAIPALPRSVLSRLTTAMIDRMDQLDADPDMEADHDDEDSHD